MLTISGKNRDDAAVSRGGLEEGSDDEDLYGRPVEGNDMNGE